MFNDNPRIKKNCKHLAKCGRVSKTACRRMTANLKECIGCTLVKRVGSNYKLINKIEHKKCGICGEWMTLDKFYQFSRNSKDGTKVYSIYSPYCKVCTSIKNTK